MEWLDDLATCQVLPYDQFYTSHVIDNEEIFSVLGESGNAAQTRGVENHEKMILKVT